MLKFTPFIAAMTLLMALAGCSEQPPVPPKTAKPRTTHEHLHASYKAHAQPGLDSQCMATKMEAKLHELSQAFPENMRPYYIDIMTGAVKSINGGYYDEFMMAFDDSKAKVMIETSIQTVRMSAVLFAAECQQ